MTPEQKAAIEWQCQQLALKYMQLTDQQDWADACALFTADASFARPTDPDNPIVGRAAIQAAFEGRPAGRLTRHVCSNQVVTAISPTEATGTLYATLYTGDAANTAKLGVNADARQLVGEFYDRYVLTDEGWRIASRSGAIIFTVE